MGFGIVAGRFTAILMVLPGSSILELLDFFQLTAQSGLLGDAIKLFFLLLKSLEPLLPLIFGPFVLFYSLGPASHGSS